MAYRTVLDQVTDEGRQYHGPAERAVAEFSGPPEQVLPADFTVKLMSSLLLAIKGNGGRLLKVEAATDTTPTFYTKYRIGLTVAEAARQQQYGYASLASPFPFAVLLPVLLVLGLVALAAWQVSKVDWGETAKGIGISVLAVVAGAVVLFLIMGAKRKG